MAETGTALTRADSTAWSIACNREPAIRSLASLPKITRAAMLNASAELGLSRSRVFELVARYRAEPVTSSLVDRPEGFPKGRRRLAPEIDQVVASEIERFYLTGTVRISVCERTIEHYAAMALMNRSPKMTANWALAMDHSRGGIFHSFSERFKIR